MGLVTLGPTTPASSTAPRQRLSYVDNRTPFRVFQCDKMGPGRRYYDVVIVKGTFALAQGRLERASEPEPILLADTYLDAEQPEGSSVELAGDAVVTKPTTDS